MKTLYNLAIETCFIAICAYMIIGIAKDLGDAYGVLCGVIIGLLYLAERKSTQRVLEKQKELDKLKGK